MAKESRNLEELSDALTKLLQTGDREGFERMIRALGSNYTVVMNDFTKTVEVVYDSPKTSEDETQVPLLDRLDRKREEIAKMFMDSSPMDSDQMREMIRAAEREMSRVFANDQFMNGPMPKPPPRDKREEARRRMLEFELAKRGNGPWNPQPDWNTKPEEKKQLEEDSLFEIPDEEDTLRALNLEMMEPLKESNDEQREEEANDDGPDRRRHA